jgi:CxxC motif-containing protein (DUF1111 family)
MAKSHLACKLPFASIAAMMFGVTAAQNALAQKMITTNPASHSNQSSAAVDPGPRGGTPGAGGPLPGLSTAQLAFFTSSLARFQAVETVPTGLGPGFNDIVCSNCHAFPAVGGSSPITNPQVADATLMGAANTVPSFITSTGPVREARFVLNPDGTPDGGVHDLFTIAGRRDAPGCVDPQPNFTAQLAANNVIFRIPTPTFGLGLLEETSDLALQTAFSANASQKGSLGISGMFNVSGNTGTTTRFGWKAQNPSLLVFTGEAYNVEEGVTNDNFPFKRDTTPSCQFNPLPEDTTNLTDADATGSTAADLSSDIVVFAMFMRLLAPPTPVTSAGASPTASASSNATASAAATTTASTTTLAPVVASVLPTAAGSSAAAATSAPTGSAASITSGQQTFINIGCATCHIQNQTTGNAAPLGGTQVRSITNFTYQPFSDFAVHSMGTGLADRVTQGNANGFQFRSAPLWGIGQRLFFLHDGRTNNLLTAIEDHASSGSEANQVISAFNMLSTNDQQNVLNFLRSL